jgi:hypothetical protein
MATKTADTKDERPNADSDIHEDYEYYHVGYTAV